jgi:lipopolysaccharide export system permease protein
MKILDRYLVKQFLQTILFGILAFTVIFVVIDLMENLDDFIDNKVPFVQIVHYYMVFSPEIIRLITPISVLFAALFTAGKSANLSELTAIKASGVSMARFMLPFMITTVFICMFSIYFSGYVVPKANKTKLNIEVNYLRKGGNFSENNIFFQDSKTRIVNINFFDEANKTAMRVCIQDFNPSDITQMVQRIDCQSMKYDTVKNVWIGNNVIKRIFTGDRQKQDDLPSLRLDSLNFKPGDIASKQQKPEQMNLSELKYYAQTQQKSGNDPRNIWIEYYSRFAFAMSSFVVLLFGLPISANKRKGGMAAQVGLNILVTFIYLVFMKISQAFGKNGAIDPILTAWMANIIFFLASFINISKMRQ